MNVPMPPYQADKMAGVVDYDAQDYATEYGDYDPYAYDSQEWRSHSLPQILRYYRELYDRSIYQVAEDLRIRAANLKALEAAQYDQLPGVTYASGFVRTYATYLGLPEDEMVQRFRFEARTDALPQPGHVVNPITVAVASQARAQANSKAPRGFALVASVVLMISGFAAWYAYNNVGIWRFQDGFATYARNGETVVVDFLGAGELPSIPGEEVEVSTEAELAALESLTPDVKQIVDRSPTDTNAIQATDDLQIVSAAVVPSADIQIIAKQLVWVQIYDLQGKIVASEVLDPGEVYAVPKKANLRLVVDASNDVLSTLDVKIDGSQVRYLQALDAEGRIYSIGAQALRNAV